MLRDAILSVSNVNNVIKDILENVPDLKSIHVKGEISNCKCQSNGHLFFSLKDNKAAIRCVMFNNYTYDLQFKPKDGDEVIVTASISVYSANGSYSLIVYNMEESGLGQSLVELEKLKQKLQKEGLFDESRKRIINRFPRLIGVITSYPSAAAEDIKINVQRRYPLTSLIFYPTQVQGEGSVRSILMSLNKAYGDNLDTLIIARGGGSHEDLWSFNNEDIVRKVALSPCPTISAVGHEIDMTLIDFVADKRASTPTAAAEYATVNKDDLHMVLADDSQRLNKAINFIIDQNRQKVFLLKNRSFFINKDALFTNNMEKIAQYKNRLKHAYLNQINYNKTAFDKDKNQLQNAFKSYLEALKNKVNIDKNVLISMNPYSILKRGYSITETLDGVVVTDSQVLQVNQLVKTTFKNGNILSKVTEKEDT